MARGIGFLLFWVLACARLAFSQTNLLEKPVDFQWTQTSLADALDDLSKEIGLSLAYDSEILPETSITLSCGGQQAGKVLDQLLRPANLAYAIKGNTLVILVAEKVLERFVTISGYVEDRETGERLAGATVFEARSKRGVLANEAGYFSLKIPADSAKLVFSVIGYAVHAERISGKSDIRKVFKMVPNLELKTVEILEDAELKGIDELAGASVVNVPVSELDKLPTLLGEADVYTALKLYPGIHSGGDGSSGLYVRGGGPDQNLVLMDGIPIYNSSHLFGFYSIFNADAISGIELYKGGFPARYGGRLSSVIEIAMREGDPEQFHGEANIGLSAARLSLSGPIFKGKTTFVLAARRTIMEPFFAVVNKVEAARNGNSVNYSFFDINAKITHRFSDRDRLFITYYQGGDNFGSGYYIDTSNVADLFDFKLNWGNAAGVVKWRRDWSKSLFSDISLYATQYDYRASSINELDYLGQDSIRNELVVTSHVRDIGFRAQFDWIPGPRHFIRFGGTSTLRDFVPETFAQLILENQTDTTENITGQERKLPLETTLFVEENLKLGPLRINAGVNFVLYFIDKTRFSSIQPRFSSRLTLPKGFALEGNFTQMVQYLHLLTNAGVGLPTDLWVPSTSRIPPQKASQGSFGIEKSFPKLKMEAGVEAYGKLMTQLIEYQTGINFLGSNDWENLVETNGKGWSYGVECFVRRYQGRFTSTVGYTFSRTQRQFPTINFGEPFFYKYDRTHDFSIATTYQIAEKLSVSASWIYATGNAITFPKSVRFAPTSPLLGFWDLNEGPNLNVIIDYGERNSFRMPPYHRMDINLSYKWKRKKLEWHANLGVFNLYNRRNPYFLFLRADYADDPSSPEIKARKMSLLPVLPSLNLGCKF